MSLETLQAKYPVVHDGPLGVDIKKLSLKEAVDLKKDLEPDNFVWSARLSSGIFGLTNCRSGNSPYAPKGENEVMLAIGDNGLRSLIDLGFLPCPTCHPEESDGFWPTAKPAILFTYPKLSDEKQFLDRNLIPFDARRVRWETLAPFLTSMPNRLYIPQGLSQDQIGHFKFKIKLLGFTLPPLGYYDHSSPTRFTEYKL